MVEEVEEEEEEEEKVQRCLKGTDNDVFVSLHSCGLGEEDGVGFVFNLELGGLFRLSQIILLNLPLSDKIWNR